MHSIKNKWGILGNNIRKFQISKKKVNQIP